MSCYCNANLPEVLRDTLEMDRELLYKAFLEKLPERAVILDVGCGLGKDSLHFKKLGHFIMAMDESEEVCQCAGEYIGQSVLMCRFQDFDIKILFDGIWACASLLHIASKELAGVLKRLAWHLKENGIIYASFRYGDFEGEQNGRYYLDLTEEKAKKFFTEAGLNIEKMWITHGTGLNHVDEAWLNILACRKSR